MTDQKKPDLLVPDRSIVSIEEAKRELSRPRNPMSAKHDIATMEQVMEQVQRVLDACERGIVDASLATGQKVYDQIAEETSGLLELMEHTIRQSILAELEARTLRGRARALWRRFVAPPVTAPALVPEYDAELARLRTAVNGPGCKVCGEAQEYGEQYCAAHMMHEAAP